MNTMNKLQRKQLDNKHTHKHFDGWTNFTGEPRVSQTQPQCKSVSYRTKQQQRDELKLEKEGWK